MLQSAPVPDRVYRMDPREWDTIFMRYRSSDVISVNTSGTDAAGTLVLRSLVVRATSGTGEYALKIQPAVTHDQINAAKREIEIHAALTRVSLVSLRKSAVVPTDSITDDREFDKQVEQLACANIVQLLDFAIAEPRRQTIVPGYDPAVFGPALVAAKSNLLPDSPLFAARRVSVMVMRYVQQTFADWIQTAGLRAFHADNLAPVLLQLLSTLQSLQALGFSHLDLHPSNVMLLDRPASIGTALYYAWNRDTAARVPLLDDKYIVAMTDFGFSFMSFVDTAGRHYNSVPSGKGRFDGLFQRGEIVPGAGKQFCPAYDMARLAFALLFAYHAVLDKETGARRVEAVNSHAQMLAVLRTMLDATGRSVHVKSMHGSLGAMLATTDEKRVEDFIQACKDTSKDSVYRLADVHRATHAQLWDIARLPVFGKYLTPRQNVQGCEDMTLRPAVGPKKRYVPEEVNPAETERAAIVLNGTIAIK